MIEIGTQITHSKESKAIPEAILFTTNLKETLNKIKEEDHLV
jgi:hypothetical protein